MLKMATVLRITFFIFITFCTLMPQFAKSSMLVHPTHPDRRIHVAASQSRISYKTLYYEQPVDHFSFANQDTYQMRYLMNDASWDSNAGPIFFYCGNEGDIELFSNNTGAMWEWAPEFKAMVVFAEHRYYGKSMPYGEDSYKDIAHLGYLSSEQAMADFARLITYIKSSVDGAEKSPVIAFGGSYGGMLATWFRMKYPHVIQGSLAASAPIWMFGNLNPCNNFNRIVTADFAKSGAHCADNIKASWAVFDKLGQSAEGRQKLTSTFKLCSPLQSVQEVGDLKGWLYNAYGNLAMADYPYPASFLEPLPAWPIKAVCSYLNVASPSDDELMSHLSSAMGVYYNYTGSSKCLNVSQGQASSLGDIGWDFQACSEMVMPICSDGKTDMFEPNPWNLEAFAAGCKKRWGVITRPDWALVVYGGKDLKATSNIIFSNGGLDPWSGGGVLADLSPSLTAIFIPEGAHHLDLRASNPADPPSVTSAREQEKTIIRKWIQDYSTASREEYFIQRISFEWIPGAASIHHRPLLPGLFFFAAVVGSLAFLMLLIVRRNRRMRYAYVVHTGASPAHKEARRGEAVYPTEKAPLL